MSSILQKLLFLTVVLQFANCKTRNEMDSSVKEAQDIQAAPVGLAPDLSQSFRSVLDQAGLDFKNSACECERQNYRKSGVMYRDVICAKKNPISQSQVSIAACNPGNVELPTLILETKENYFQLVFSPEKKLFRVTFLNTKKPNSGQNAMLSMDISAVVSKTNQTRTIPFVDEKSIQAIQNLNAIAQAIGPVPKTLLERKLKALQVAFSAHLWVEVASPSND